MVLGPEELEITITLKYGNYVVEGRVVGVYESGILKFVVIESKKNAFVFNLSATVLDKITCKVIKSHNVYTYYTSNQIMGVLERLFKGSVVAYTDDNPPELQVKIKDSDGYVVSSSTEDIFIKKFTGELPNDIGPITVPTTSANNNGTNNALNNTCANRHSTYYSNSYYSRDPTYFGSILAEVFGGKNEDNRKPIGYAAVKCCCGGKS